MNYGQGGGGQYPPGYTQPGYPASNPYGQPPPPANAYQPMPQPGMGMGAQPPKSNMGLIIGIIGGVLGLGLIIFLVFVFAIFRAASTSSSSVSTNSPSDNTSSSSSDELTLPFLQNVARDASVGLPRMLDSETQEENVTASPGTLIYHNRLVHKTVGQLSVPVFTQVLKPSIVANDCSNSAVRNQLLLKGVTLRYTYVDKFGAFVASIDITKHDCGI